MPCLSLSPHYNLGGGFILLTFQLGTLGSEIRCRRSPNIKWGHPHLPTHVQGAGEESQSRVFVKCSAVSRSGPKIKDVLVKEPPLHATPRPIHPGPGLSSRSSRPLPPGSRKATVGRKVERKDGGEEGAEEGKKEGGFL